MRSEFEKTLKQHRDALTDELEKLGKHRQAQLVEWDIEQNESDYEFYFNAGWNAQQSKVDELQNKFDQHDQWLGQRNKDVQELNDIIAKHATENDELQVKLKQAYEDIETFATAHQRECEFKAQFAKEKDELQKRVYELATAFNQLIEMESESISTELDQFDKGWNQSARQTIENIFKLTGLGEQALKGGSDE